MTLIALTTFLEVSTASGAVQHRFHNSGPNDQITHRGTLYPYLSFIYKGAATTRTGDNLESGLVLANNALSMGYAHIGVTSRWNVRVDTCSMTRTAGASTVARILSTEYWLMASMTYDVETIEVLLSSSIDAVGASAPTRVLTRELVGALPPSSNIQNR